MRKLLFAVFDRTGNISEPYRQDPDWTVIQIDIQPSVGRESIDFLTYDYEKVWNDVLHQPMQYILPEVGIIFAMPCDNYALSGAKHFKAKDEDGRTEFSQKLVDRAGQMVQFFQKRGVLKFWQLENPRTRIHTIKDLLGSLRNAWIGKIRQRFNPWNFAKYDPIHDDSRYNKDTWLFGDFELMIWRPLEPFEKENPGWRNLGGKSLRTKNLRSISPKGFCYAFYESNH